MHICYYHTIMKHFTALVLVIIISSASAIKIGNNMAGASLFNQGGKFGSHISEKFNKFSNPKHSITYDNSILDFTRKVPVFGEAVDSVATGFRLGEGIGHHIVRKVINHFNENKPKFPAV